MIAAAKAIGYDRASFDRCEQLGVQPTMVRTDRHLRARLLIIRLTSTLKDGRLRGFFAT
jgi:hypothetical protein